MSANPAPQTPVEPPGAAAPTPHDRHLGAIAAWLGEKSDTDLLVEVVSGLNRTEVARGRYVDMEAHPSARGVYRLVFDNSKAGPDAPTGQQWVAVGHELVDVAAGDTSLILDKGSQRIEVHVLDALQAAPEPMAAVGATAPQVVVPADRTASASVEAPSLIEAYAPTLQAVAAAPVHQNATLLASRLFGEAKLEVSGDHLKVTARRMRHGTSFFVLTATVIGAFAVAGGILYAIVVLGMRFGGPTSVGDLEFLESFRYGLAGIVAAAVVLYLIGRLISTGTPEETIVAPLADVAVRSSRRVFVLRGPFGRKERRRSLVLKPAGKADRASLEEIVDHIRARQHR